MQRKRLLLLVGAAIGAIIIIVGIFGLITPVTNFLEIIDIENEARNNIFTSGESKTYYFDTGSYDIYYYSEFYSTPRTISIIDPNEDEVSISLMSFGYSETFEVSGREYNKLGSFNAEIKGNYTITIENLGTLLILEKGFFLSDIFTIVIYGFLIALGGLIFSICTIFLVIEYINKTKKNKI